MRRRYLQQLNLGFGFRCGHRMPDFVGNQGNRRQVGPEFRRRGQTLAQQKIAHPATIGGTQRRSAADRQVPDVVVEHLTAHAEVFQVSCGHRRRPLGEVLGHEFRAVIEPLQGLPQPGSPGEQPCRAFGQHFVFDQCAEVQRGIETGVLGVTR